MNNYQRAAVLALLPALVFILYGLGKATMPLWQPLFAPIFFVISWSQLRESRKNGWTSVWAIVLLTTALLVVLFPIIHDVIFFPWGSEMAFNSSSSAWADILSLIPVSLLSYLVAFVIQLGIDRA